MVSAKRSGPTLVPISMALAGFGGVCVSVSDYLVGVKLLKLDNLGNKI